MINAKEAKKLSEEHKQNINKEALTMIEQLVLAACKRGENFCEAQKIPDPIIALLKENDYSVVITSILINLDGLNKSVSGFKIYW